MLALADSGISDLTKVLHVYRTYFPDPPGGLQEAIRQIALATKHFGVESRVFTLSPQPLPARLEHGGVTIVRARSFAAPASCDLGGPDSLRSFAEEANWADVIHFHYPWPFADLLRLWVDKSKPTVMTYHSDIVKQRFLKHIYGPLMHRTLSSMSAIVATSPAYAATSPVLVDPRHADRVRVIPLGIDESTYPSKGDETVLTRLGLENGEPFFMFIGVLRYYKGLHFLLDAAKLLDAKIVVAGTGPEGAKLKQQAQQLGLENLVFAGQVTDTEKVSLLKACRALVLPSHLRSEAYGMVLVEASIFGKPLVSCNIGTGTSFVNEDGVSGLVVPSENVVALASSLNTLLYDDALTERLGRNARSRYEQMFSGPALGRAYATLYQDVAVKV